MTFGVCLRSRFSWVALGAFLRVAMIQFCFLLPFFLYKESRQVTTDKQHTQHVAGFAVAYTSVLQRSGWPGASCPATSTSTWLLVSGFRVWGCLGLMITVEQGFVPADANQCMAATLSHGPAPRRLSLLATSLWYGTRPGILVDLGLKV